VKTEKTEPGSPGRYFQSAVHLRPGAGLSILLAMELTAADVRKLALLSRLHVPEEDLSHVAGQLQHILEHLEELSSLDLADVPPMMHPDSGERPLRADEPLPSLPRDLALSNAPKAVEGFFAIPKVIGAA